MNRKLGILGGGQLAMMMTQAAFRLGITDVTVLDPTEDCPASKVGAKQIVGSFRDREKILELAKMVDVLTIDIESVNIDALEEAKEYCEVYPDPSCLRVIQDKFEQKIYMKNLGIPVVEVISGDELPECGFVVKAKKGGYDGKGVWIMKTSEDVDAFLEKYDLKDDDNMFVEELVDINAELAVMSFVRESGVAVNYPIVETVQDNGICVMTVCPVSLDLHVRIEINNIVKRVVQSFNTRGMFGIELFLTKDGRVLLNEVSPRVHNSGHYTIEATNCSQFEQHIRSVMGMNMLKPELTISPVVMYNILAKGDETDFVKSYKGLHWYCKSVGENGMYKKRRKIGHATTKLAMKDRLDPVIYIVMGSTSDYETLRPGIELLEHYNIPICVDVVSAHRSPEWMFTFGRNVESWGGKVVIAAAGGAAHLPGMLASITNLPVIGVPIPSKNFQGKDSLLSIVEMPDGVPVATVGIGKSKNAAILALKMIGEMEIVSDIKRLNQEKVNMQRSILSENKNEE